MIVVAVPIHHKTGRISYAAHLLDAKTRAIKSVCPHFDGHRTLKAAAWCGGRMKRAYERT